VHVQRTGALSKTNTLCEDMNDYSVLKSSREALLRKAGFQEGHNIFNSGSPDQSREVQVEGAGNYSGSPDGKNG